MAGEVVVEVVEAEDDVAQLAVLIGDVQLGDDAAVVGDLGDDAVLVGQGVELHRLTFLGLSEVGFRDSSTAPFAGIRRLRSRLITTADQADGRGRENTEAEKGPKGMHACIAPSQDGDSFVPPREITLIRRVSVATARITRILTA